MMLLLLAIRLLLRECVGMSPLPNCLLLPEVELLRWIAALPRSSRGARFRKGEEGRQGKERRIASEDKEVKGSRVGGERRIQRPPPAPQSAFRGSESLHAFCEGVFLGPLGSPPRGSQRSPLAPFPRAGIPGALWVPRGERWAMKGLTGVRDAWIETPPVPPLLVLGGPSGRRDGGAGRGVSRAKGALWVQRRLWDRGRESRKWGGGASLGQGSAAMGERARASARKTSLWGHISIMAPAGILWRGRLRFSLPPRKRPPLQGDQRGIPGKWGGRVPTPVPSCNLYPLPTP
ncbi:Hypothetical predicted protein [Podarcis lilfordi]|uniref:Uncharacterized protein n=1 Tax=Podarcis lilfordi TaxID=74358 RepID=A0AA35W1Z1_9SAUR|nr:Hypothetical predicted protein [Podarcis lilfordi]